jgi:hypothetical protein
MYAAPSHSLGGHSGPLQYIAPSHQWITKALSPLQHAKGKRRRLGESSSAGKEALMGPAPVGVDVIFLGSQHLYGRQGPTAMTKGAHRILEYLYHRDVYPYLYD